MLLNIGFRFTVFEEAKLKRPCVFFIYNIKKNRVTTITLTILQILIAIVGK